jgi:hypothetical protein
MSEEPQLAEKVLYVSNSKLLLLYKGYSLSSDKAPKDYVTTDCCAKGKRLSYVSSVLTAANNNNNDDDDDDNIDVCLINYNIGVVISSRTLIVIP